MKTAHHSTDPAGAYRLDHCLSTCPATWREVLGGANALVTLVSDAGRLKSWFRKSLTFTESFEYKIEDHPLFCPLYFDFYLLKLGGSITRI